MIKILYIPVEIKNRDFYPRLLLACYAAERGYEVVLAKDTALKSQISKMPKGLIFDKSLARGKRFDILNLLNQGFAYASEDAETMGYYREFGQDEMLDHRVDEVLVVNSCGYFAWGERQREIILKKYPELRENIYVAGSIRRDILQYPYRIIFEKEISSIRERFGQFFLFNSHFGDIHHLQGVFHIINQLRDTGQVKTDDDVREQMQWYAKQELDVLLIQQALRKCAMSFPGHRVVIRPHTVEEPRFWRYLTHDAERIDVVSEFSVIPWILASDLVLHAGCTTAVEAIWAGKNCLTMPSRALKGDGSAEVIVSIAESVPDTETLIRRIRELLAEEPIHAKTAHDVAAMESHFGSYEEKTACERILDSFDALDWQVSLNKCYGKFNGLAIDRPKTLHKISPELHAKKCPPIDKVEIESILAKWQKVGRFKKVFISKQIGNSMFHLRKIKD